MPKTSNKLSSFSSMQKESISNKEAVKSLASFSNTKEFKKRNTEEMLPAMTCHKELVAKFKKEAKEKKWKYTTLMNEILEERYGKVEN